MGNITKNHKKNEHLKKIGIILINGFAQAIALNKLLIPSNVFSAGVNGISQLISSGLDQSFQFHIDTGLLIFIINLPIFVLGWIKLGKNSTLYSMLNVLSVSLMTMMVSKEAITNNPLMSAIIGGVLLGVGVGLSLKYGFTTGGMDIISLVLAKTTGKTVGSLMFVMNLLIIAGAGLMFDWESALYTIISIYCMTQVIDTIHTSHQKITAMIITLKKESVMKSIQKEVSRGMTLLPTIGGYTGHEGTMIIMVVTRYELYALEQAVYDVDEKAFINILPTQTVMGDFWSEDQQKEAKELTRY